jgi:RNA polymerase sigma-70 factor (ECF subfamily)
VPDRISAIANGAGVEHRRTDWLQQPDDTANAPTQDAPPEARRLRLVTPSADSQSEVASATLYAETVSDDELIAALVAGEVAALAALYARHAQLVFSMLMRIVGDRSAAEDLLQEAFLRAWQHAHTFDENRGTVRGWLVRIAHNLALNELRRQRRRPHTHRRASSDEADDEVAGSGAGPDPAVDAWCSIRDDGLAQALSQLPPAQRAVLSLYAAGFSQSEIATNLGQPLGTVKSRMRRALFHLREALAVVGIDSGWRPD